MAKIKVELDNIISNNNLEKIKEELKIFIIEEIKKQIVNNDEKSKNSNYENDVDFFLDKIKEFVSVSTFGVEAYKVINSILAFAKDDNLTEDSWFISIVDKIFGSKAVDDKIFTKYKEIWNFCRDIELFSDWERDGKYNTKYVILSINTMEILSLIKKINKLIK